MRGIDTTCGPHAPTQLQLLPLASGRRAARTCALAHAQQWRRVSCCCPRRQLPAPGSQRRPLPPVAAAPGSDGDVGGTRSRRHPDLLRVAQGKDGSSSRGNDGSGSSNSGDSSSSSSGSSSLGGRSARVMGGAVAPAPADAPAPDPPRPEQVDDRYRRADYSDVWSWRRGACWAQELQDDLVLTCQPTPLLQSRRATTLHVVVDLHEPLLTVALAGEFGSLIGLLIDLDLACTVPLGAVVHLAESGVSGEHKGPRCCHNRCSSTALS